MRLVHAVISAVTLTLATSPVMLSTAYATAAVQEAEVLLEGSFEGREGKRGSGNARIIRQDGQLYLEFENFRTSRGPQLEIWITDRTVRSNKDVQAAGYIDLGKLESHRKSRQRYELPANFDLNAAASVVIWCEPFAILFASADLS